LTILTILVLAFLYKILISLPRPLQGGEEEKRGITWAFPYGGTGRGLYF
jgi:hypothetical protein